MNRQQQSSKMIVLITIVAALAGLLFGIDTGVISGALPLLQKEFNISTFEQEIVVSAVLFGAFIGTIAGSFISKKYGRKSSLILASAIYAISSLLSSSASDQSVLIVYRLMLGFSVGIAAFVAPMYLSEMAPKRLRGGIISMYQVMVYLGIFLSFVSDTIFTYFASWRGMLGIIAIPAVIMFALLWLLPKSPRWLLMSKGNDDQARQILTKIRESNDEITAEIDEISHAINQTKSQSGFKLFCYNRHYRKVVGFGILLQAMQQFTGINMIFYYASIVFGMAGFNTPVSQGWVTVFIGIVNIIACLIAIPLVDKKGRKPLLYYGYLGMTVAMVFLSLVFYIGVTSLALKILAIIAIVLFLVTFAFSSGPVIWVLCAEIFPLQGRDFGLCIATCTNWISNFILALFFLSVLKGIGPGNTFMIFAIINFVCLFLIYYFIPETRGISLESIEQNLFSGVRLKNLGQTK
ncbi:sugar porter family MFS transporter [Cysteiniphilum halobium]|uniref:sugar porter family MFS transporter n=1 Tax=Cysteiniphilum halobium TaxID=2219059 RepID=UPI000E6528F8|nr:sugar porter family MFS transporter [Cysteiniphilum halobium]